MYITINGIKGEKRIDLSYSIQNFDSSKEITVIRILSDNVQYQMLKLLAVMDPISDTKKTIPSRTYANQSSDILQHSQNRRFQVELMQVENYCPC